MNLDIQDPKLLSSLSPRNIQAYLKSAGWTLAHEAPGAANYYRLAATPDDYEVVVPLSESASGYAQRVKELLRELKTIEQRPELQVFQDIEEWDADVIRLSLEFDGAHMAPRVEFLRTFLEAGRDLLLYGAALAVEPKEWYGDSIPAEAFEYLKTVEVSSFEEPWTIRFRSRLSPALTDEEDYVPFTRQVTTSIQDALAGWHRIGSACVEMVRAIQTVLDHPEALRAKFTVSVRPALCRPVATADAYREIKFSQNHAPRLREILARLDPSKQALGLAAHWPKKLLGQISHYPGSHDYVIVSPEAWESTRKGMRLPGSEISEGLYKIEVDKTGLVRFLDVESAGPKG